MIRLSFVSRCLVPFWCVFAFGQSTLVPHVTHPQGPFITEINLVNTSDLASEFTLKPFDAAGMPLQEIDGILEAGENRWVLQTDLLPQESSHFIVEGNLEIRLAYRTKQGSRMATVSVPGETSNGWQMAQEPGFIHAFAVVNDGLSETDIVIRHLDGDGRLLQEASPPGLAAIPPLNKRLFVLDSLFASVPDSFFQVQANEPLGLTALKFQQREDQLHVTDGEPGAQSHNNLIFGLSQLPPEQRALVSDFQTALTRFRTLDLEAFQTQYSSQKDYLGKLPYDPTDAASLDLISQTYPLSPAQWDSYKENGFVVADNLRFDSFFEGFKNVYQRHLPVYVSADAILDALHLSFDRMLLDLETHVLLPRLEAMLVTLEAGLNSVDDYGDGPSLDTAKSDLSFWVCAARALLDGDKIPCDGAGEIQVSAFLDHIEEGAIGREVSLFGRTTKIDFSQFTPRGHYTRSQELERYFQAMMWIQRIGMAFSEDSRHGTAAWLLSKILKDSGAIKDWHVIEQVLRVVMGTSDSLNPLGLLALAENTGMTQTGDFQDPTQYRQFVQTALASGAGLQRINSAILAADPTREDSFTPIPPAFFLMGQRFVLDSHVFTNVVFDRVRNPARFLPDPLDVWFVLGNRAALPLLEDQLNQHHYQSNLAAMDWLVGQYDPGFWNENLYHSWLNGLRILHKDTTGDAFPSVMQTETWDRRMLQAQMGSWAHLRHDTILYAKASYSFITCEYPAGWVDPYPEFYEALDNFAEQALLRFEPLGVFEVFQDLDTVGEGETHFSGLGLKTYLTNFRNIMASLKAMAETQIANQDHSEEQLQFLNQMILFGCGDEDIGGWYKDLLYQFHLGNAEAFDPTIADIHTDAERGRILHVGVGHPNLMVLSVQNECGIQSYAGPVFSYHQLVAPSRMNDDQWKAMQLNETSTYESTRPDWVKDFVK